MIPVTVDRLRLKGKRVFIRVDFNLPITQHGEFGDDTRIREALPTVRHVVDQGARVLLASHLGRPKGKLDPSLSLKPVAERVGKLLKRPVVLASDCVGAEVEKEVSRISEGEVLLLENLRFHPGEEKNDPDFGRGLAELADIYINDAFGSSHRPHASIVGMVRHFTQKGMGFLMQKEVAALSRLREKPERPFIVILGGAKVSHKIGLIRNLLPRIDTIIVGGAIAYTFQKAQGIAVGDSQVETDQLGEAEKIFEKARHCQVTILLPQDHIAAVDLVHPTFCSVTPGREIPEHRLGADIGPKTIELFSAALRGSRTVFWNGPMGISEMPPYDRGTLALARAMPDRCFKVVGGGDTVAALARANLLDRFDHFSTGGGASLEFLENGDLPGLAALRNGDQS